MIIELLGSKNCWFMMYILFNLEPVYCLIWRGLSFIPNVCFSFAESGTKLLPLIFINFHSFWDKGILHYVYCHTVCTPELDYPNSCCFYGWYCKTTTLACYCNDYVDDGVKPYHYIFDSIMLRNTKHHSFQRLLSVNALKRHNLLQHLYPFHSSWESEGLQRNWIHNQIFIPTDLIRLCVFLI